MVSKAVWIAVAVVAFVGVGAVLYPFITNPTSVSDAYEQVGIFAPLLFIALVMVAPTPGAIVGVSGVGYFGLPEAAMYLYIGNLLGVTITFLLVKRFGRPVAERFVKPEKLALYDGFIKRNPVLQWLVYTVPLFPIELITFVIALSEKKFKQFFWTVAIALPFYALFVTTIGWQLSSHYQNLLEYASVAITLIIVYSTLHFLYVWNQKEIHETGRKLGSQVKHGVNHITDATDKVTEQIKKIGRKKKKD